MFDTIQSQFSREIYFKNIILDISIKRVYATDASEYRENPRMLFGSNIRLTRRFMWQQN